MKKSLLSLLLVSTIIFAGTYDNTYVPVGEKSVSNLDPFMYGSFKEIKRFDLLGATDVKHQATHSKELC